MQLNAPWKQKNIHWRKPGMQTKEHVIERTRKALKNFFFFKLTPKTMQLKLNEPGKWQNMQLKLNEPRKRQQQQKMPHVVELTDKHAFMNQET